MKDQVTIRHPVGLDFFTDVADLMRQKHGEAIMNNREMSRFINSLGLAEEQWKRAVRPARPVRKLVLTNSKGV